MSEHYISKIKDFFEHLSSDNADLVDDFYHNEAHFIDPLVNLRGSTEIKSYYRNIYTPVEEINFEFSDFVQEGNKIAAFWTMNLKAPKLNKGKMFPVKGMSHFCFDQASGLVSYHRDYYDVGEFIYEKIPLISRLIKIIKNRLSKH